LGTDAGARAGITRIGWRYSGGQQRSSYIDNKSQSGGAIMRRWKQRSLVSADSPTTGVRETPGTSDRRAWRDEGQYQGKFYLDWIPYLDQLRRENRNDEVLQMLLEIIPIIERASASGSMRQSLWAVEWAATILRARRQHDEEVELLEAHLRHDSSGTLAARLDRARALLAQSQQGAEVEVR
jgi:hypothetical protein